MRWQRIETLVQSALEIAEQERTAWLSAHCDGDESLRVDVASLLAVEDESESFLHKPAVSKAASLLAENEVGFSRTGEQIGSYRILGEIGRGGMGVVYLAAREDAQFLQRVAIKLVRRGLDTEDILRRFRNERQILASLNHPHIARLFDGGTTADGLPYFVMEYVEGLPLLEYCDENRLSKRERLQLFRTICAPVQHAHQNLVVHRDLKPSNILVTHEGEVKLLDFGVAKLLNPELTGSALTATRAARAMTPEYASPEQVRGQHVTTATDIYSLGVILYELLTGARPYKLNDISPEEMSRVICDTEPTKPSDAVSGEERGKERRGVGKEDKSSRGVASSRLLSFSPSALRGDLDNIVLMALRKEPSRRYKSVEQFSVDIERHLKGLPVNARKDTFAYRTSKFVQRHKPGVAAALLIALAVIAGLIGTIWQASAARKQRDAALAAQVRSEKINAFMQSIFSYANPDWFARSGGRRDVTVLEAMRDIEKHIDTDFQDEPDLRADVYQQIGDSYRTQFLYADAERNLREALRLRLQLYGEDNAKVAESLYILSGVRVQQGDAAEYERLLTQAISIQRRHPHEGNNLPYMIVDYASMLENHKGDFAGALALHREALEDFREHHGENHFMIAGIQSLIAEDYFHLGDYAQAETSAQEYLKSAQPSDFSALRELSARSIFAHCLIIRGDYKAAQRAIEQMVSVSKSKGLETLYVAFCDDLQSSAAYYQGNYAQAKTYAEKLTPVNSRNARSPSNSDPRDSIYPLARSLNKLGETRRAEILIRDEIDWMKGSPFAENLFLAARLDSVLGESLTAEHRFNEAETLLLRAHEILKARVLPQESTLVDTRQRLAQLYRVWGKEDEARKYY